MSDDAGLAWELLQRFTDPATTRFDAALDAAGLDPDTVRLLRFWQRESVAGVKQYAAHALPAVFAALAAAQDDVAAAAHRAADTWDSVASTGTRPDLVVLNEEPDVPAASTEHRRRTVAARLAQIG